MQATDAVLQPYRRDWYVTSRKVREAANGTCAECGRVSYRLHVHHRDGNQLNDEPENLVALCVQCHRKAHGKTPRARPRSIVSPEEVRELLEWEKAAFDPEDKSSALAFVDRFIDKRYTKDRIVLKKVPSLIRLPSWVWQTLDRNRLPMGMSRSQFVQFCIIKTTKPYDQARAAKREDIRPMTRTETGVAQLARRIVAEGKDAEQA